MKNDLRTLRGIAREVFSEGYLQRARQRAQRRKSPWNFLLIPLCFGGVAITLYVLFQIMWLVHTAIYPVHVGRLGEFWGKGISFGSFVPSFLLLIPLFFAALPIGMMLGNLVAWLIPPARRTFVREAEGVEGASFGDAMTGLWKISLIVVPVCLLLSLIGAATLTSLR
jgi:hypothetical protein